MVRVLKRILPQRMYRMLRSVFLKIRHSGHSSKKRKDVTGFWTKQNVTDHKMFSTAKQSEESFWWRSQQYLGYLEAMPVNQADGKTVLDYGCGPGHDSVGFLLYSKPEKLVSADVSPTSLREAEHRVGLHLQSEGQPRDGVVQFVQIDDQNPRLPFEDNTFDIIHSSGVLHHIKEHRQVLQEFKRILKPDGYAQIMVYNYSSIWMHLYTCYVTQIKQGIYKTLSKREAFAKLTDGPGCPIADCYTPDEYIKFVESVDGLKCELTGAAISAFEMQLLPQRFDALLHPRLDHESREFLYSLTYDERGFPLHNGIVAGVDACYRVTRE